MKFAKPLLISFSLLAFAGAAGAQQSAPSPQGRSAQPPQQTQNTQSQQPQQQQSQQQNRSMQSQQDQGDSASAGASSPQNRSQMGANDLIGKKVTGKDGKELGEITEVVLDLNASRVHAAVLEFGGILGMGEKSYAFPMRELKPGKNRDQFTVDVDKERLENAQGFAKGEWPAMNDEYWGRVGGGQGKASAGSGPQGKGQQQSQQPQGQSAQGSGQQQGMNLVRASEMKGKQVNDQQGQEVGDIRDVIIDMKSGQLRNVVIDVQDGGRAQVPAKQLKAGTGDNFVVAMSAEQIRKQAKSSQRQQSQSRNQGAASGASGGMATTPGSSQSQGSAAQPGTSQSGAGQSGAGQSGAGSSR